MKGALIINKIINIIILIIILLISGCGVSDNEVVKSLDSPDGNYTAVAFIRDVGATTAYSPQVSILKKGKTLKNEPGNIFVGNNSKVIDISWEDDNTLIVFFDCPKRDIYKQEEKFNDIKIKYKKQDDREVLSTKR